MIINDPNITVWHRHCYTDQRKVRQAHAPTHDGKAPRNGRPTKYEWPIYDKDRDGWLDSMQYEEEQPQQPFMDADNDYDTFAMKRSMGNSGGLISPGAFIRYRQSIGRPVASESLNLYSRSAEVKTPEAKLNIFV